MWRVYCRQWLVFFTSMATGEDGRAECTARFRQDYEGRVADADWLIETPDDGVGRSFLYLCVPNCCGEFTDQADAERHAGGHGDHPHQVVPADSAQERELLAYGVRRLRQP